jgi:hypothetical protein
MTPVANFRWLTAGVAEINEDLGKKATAVVNDTMALNLLPVSMKDGGQIAASVIDTVGAP